MHLNLPWKINQILYLFLFALLIVSCKEDEIDPPEPEPEPVELENEVNEFVWKALNSWYYYLDDVDDLDDSKDNDSTEFYTFLNGFDTPEELFDHLIIDDFSYIVDDYEELGSALEAVYNSFGYDFILYRINDTEYLGQVRFVFPDSPAEEAGLKRGDTFLKVDGQQLNVSNFESLLFDDDDYTLTMAKLTRQDDGYVIEELEDMIEVVGTEDPRTAIWVKKTLNLGGRKVGYLMYSNFASNLHQELNHAFGDFKADGVTDLILDLRYNPGGSVLTAAYLNSMIYSTDDTELMGSLEYNRKHSTQGGNIYFYDTVEFFDDEFEETGESEPINSLGLNRLYVLVSSSTASASEFVINALRPYIDVTLVGETTVGKNVGSISLYDAPPTYTEKEDANEDHTYGIQPIVSKIANSAGFTDYDNGFNPDVEISEFDFLDDLRPLGQYNANDPAKTEQLLAEAINLICPSCRTTTDRMIQGGYEKMVGVEKIFESIELSGNYQVADVSGFQ